MVFVPDYPLLFIMSGLLHNFLIVLLLLLRATFNKHFLMYVILSSMDLYPVNCYKFKKGSQHIFCPPLLPFFFLVSPFLFFVFLSHVAFLSSNISTQIIHEPLFRFENQHFSLVKRIVLNFLHFLLAFSFLLHLFFWKHPIYFLVSLSYLSSLFLRSFFFLTVNMYIHLIAIYFFCVSNFQ